MIAHGRLATRDYSSAMGQLCRVSYTVFFQFVFSLELARSNNSMSVGACAVVDISLLKYLMVF